MWTIPLFFSMQSLGGDGYQTKHGQAMEMRERSAGSCWMFKWKVRQKSDVVFEGFQTVQRSNLIRVAIGCVSQDSTKSQPQRALKLPAYSPNRTLRSP